MPEATALPYSPQDEYPHVEDDPAFNDSVYFNFYEAATKIGGVIRLGNRLQLGYAEVTVHLVLPSGALFFSYERAEIGSPTTHDSGGLKIEIIEPFETLRITFDSTGSVIQNPGELATDTGRVLRDGGGVRCDLDLTWTGRYPIHAITESGDMLEGHDIPFARDHFEQFGFLKGHITVGDDTVTVEAAQGSRDHSWGPRDWLAPKYWNASLIYMDDGTCVSASEVATHDGDLIMGGTIFTTDGKVRAVQTCHVENVYEGEPTMTTPYTVRVVASDGYAFAAKANNVAMVPLRHRPVAGGKADGIQRIGQAVSRFERDGVEGWGWTDFWRHLPEEFESTTPGA
jgi:hypothetical protein